MKFKMIKGLPVASVALSFQSNNMLLDNVLIDTGCAITIFDTDEVEPIGLTIHPTSGKAVYMYGVGGRSEVCFQQKLHSIIIGGVPLDNFTVQLGLTKIPFGFNALIGSDFFSAAKLQIDFRNCTIHRSD